MTATTGTLTEAAAVFAELADDHCLATAEKLIRDGKATWAWDPDHRNVAGLVRLGSRNREAYVVLYLDDAEGGPDFETSTTFDIEAGLL